MDKANIFKISLKSTDFRGLPTNRSMKIFAVEFWQSQLSLNPISAGVLENQDILGGVNLNPPPSKSNVWCPNITNDTSLESSCALLLESANKFTNLQNLSKKWKIIHFWKTKNVQISFDRLFAKNVAIFFRKPCVIRFLMSKAFQKAKSEKWKWVKTKI